LSDWEKRREFSDARFKYLLAEMMRPVVPNWNVPKNVSELLDSDEDGTWESDEWAPIVLKAIQGTSYDGRDIPLAWQIELDPYSEELEAANRKIEALGIEPDGYGWSNVLQSAIAEHHPLIADELHFGDTESDACVVWVESEETCKLLLQVAWSLIHDS
jgi:hypothetical protein